MIKIHIVSIKRETPDLLKTFYYFNESSFLVFHTSTGVYPYWKIKVGTSAQNDHSEIFMNPIE